ncbi:MAG: hypothetical protein V8R14_06160 [Clostridia bacterium]
MSWDLRPGTAVYGGGGDATLIGVVAHVYYRGFRMGRHGDRQTEGRHRLDDSGVAPQSGKYNYFAEMGTKQASTGARRDRRVYAEDRCRGKPGVFFARAYLSDTVTKSAAGSLTPVATRQQMSVRRSECGGDLFKHQDRDWKDRDDGLEGICYHLR